MEIILLERIERLGQMGDVVRVKNGYARNYLFPQRKALRKTKDNLAYFEARRKEFEAHNAALKSAAEELARKLDGAAVTIIRQAAETGQLYGSVTMRDVCDALQEAGYAVERAQVVLNVPFKNIGIFDVKLALHPDVSQTVRVNVARSEEDAKKLAQAHAKDEAANAKAEAAETAKAAAVEPAEAAAEEKPAKAKKASKKAEKAEEAEPAEVAEKKHAKTKTAEAAAEKPAKAKKAKKAE